MAKKVVATLRNTSGVKYAKLIRSKKSDKTGAYQFKEEIVIEDHVKDILAGKDPAELIEQMREKQDQQAPKEEAKVEDKPAEAPYCPGGLKRTKLIRSEQTQEKIDFLLHFFIRDEGFMMLPSESGYCISIPKKSSE